MPEQDLRTGGPTREQVAAKAETTAAEWQAKSSDAAPNMEVPNGNPGNVDPEVAKCLATKAQGKESLDMVQLEDGSWKWVQAGEVKGCDGDVEMSEELVKAICIAEKLYREPENNDKLQLSLKGFTAIKGLEKYVNVKALFLQGNGIKEISGLSHMKQLRTLNLDNNMIASISGLEGLTELATLQLNGNQLDRIDNLKDLPALENLQLSRNKFLTVESISHLAECTQVKVLDLQSNRIEGNGQEFLDVIKKMKVNCVYFQEIPVVDTDVKMPRKAFLGNVPSLQFYNDAPVDDQKQERRLCEAWVRGGPDEEQKERLAIQAEKKKKAQGGGLAARKAAKEKENNFRKKVAEEAGIEVTEASAVNCTIS